MKKRIENPTATVACAMLQSARRTLKRAIDEAKQAAGFMPCAISEEDLRILAAITDRMAIKLADIRDEQDELAA